MRYIIGMAMWIAVFVGLFILLWVETDLKTAIICFGGGFAITVFLMVGYYLMYGTLGRV